MRLTRTRSSAAAQRSSSEKSGVHPVNVRGIQQPLHVLAQAENGGTLLGVVAANAFEHARSIADHVGDHVDFGVVPGNEFPVVPNLFRLDKGHRKAPRAGIGLCSVAKMNCVAPSRGSRAFLG